MFVNELYSSRINLNAIGKRFANVQETEQKANTVIDSYKPVAIRSAVLYQLAQDLTVLDPLYEFSLHQYSISFKDPAFCCNLTAIKNPNTIL